MGETRGQVCFQGRAVDGADILRHDVRRPGRRNGDVEVADDAGVVRGDGVRHGGRLHKMVVRCVQQPVQDVSFVMSGLTDSLGQIKSGQEIQYSGSAKRKEKKKGLRISNFTLVLVVFKRRCGSERVKIDGFCFAFPLRHRNPAVYEVISLGA